MQLLKRPIRKHSVALALALVAGLSYVVVGGIGQSDIRPQADAGILTALASDAVGGAYQMFLKVDTIDGESEDPKHKGEIAVESFSFSESRGVSAQRPTLEAFRITMSSNAASPKLFLYSVAGTKVPHVVLSVRRAGSQQDFLKWILTDTKILSYQTVGNTKGDGITDQVTFSYAKLETEYRKTLPNGSLGPAIQAGYDQRTGKTN